MKRFVALIGFFTVALVGLSQAYAATTINLWHSYRAQEKKAIEEVVEKFNAQGKEVQIKLLYVPYDAFPDKITAAVPRGKGPDLFIFAQDRVGDWAVSEFIEPLDFWLTDELRDSFLSPTLDALTYDDSVYGLPMTFKMVALFYNKKLIKTPPKTTDELVKAAQGITDSSKKRYGLVYENANFYYQGTWFQGFGAKVFDKKGRPLLATKESIDSMSFAQDLARKHGIMPEEISSVLVSTLFNKGQAGMVIDGPWFIGSIDKGVDFGVAVLPTISATGKPATPFLTSEGIIMSARSEHKKEAFEVMQYMTSVEVGKVMAKKGRQTVARKEVHDDPEIGNDAVLKVFRAQLKNSKPMPNMPAMRMVWSPATTAMNKVINGGVAPDAAMGVAQSEVVKLVKRARK